MSGIGGSRCRRLQVAPLPAQLSEIRRFIDEIGAETQLDPERIFDLKVAVSEACANAVEHSGGVHAPLEICAWFQGDRIVVEIADSGDFRLPRVARGPAADSRGLGLPLMVALTDEVRICKLPEGGTSVTLSLLYSPASARQPAPGIADSRWLDG